MAARDDDPLRVNGQQLVNLAKEMLAGTLAGLTYPKEHLNDLRLAEGPTLAPIRVPSDQDHVEHAQKAAQFGKSVLSSWRVIYKSPPATKTASLTHYTINDVYNAYSTNATNPRAVAEKVLEAIEASNRIQPPLKAIVQCNAEDVRRQADASTQRWKEGKQLGPFDGVFVSIKENTDVLGYNARQGTSFLGLTPSTFDAETVAKLREAGAIIVGLTNMHEMGWDISGINPISGVGRNPYALDRVQGGSSGGSAASVAAGLVTLAMGGDAGGSVRIPSSYCGIYGLKPSCGRLSLAPTGGNLSMATKGIHAASARDLALAYVLLAGKSEGDVLTVNQPVPHIAGVLETPHRLKVALPSGVWKDCSHQGIIRVCKDAVNKLLGERLGHQVLDMDMLPDYALVRRGQATVAIAEMTAAICNLPTPNGEDPWSLLGPQQAYEMGLFRNTFDSRDYLQGLRMRTRAMNKFDEFFKTTANLIATPTTANVAYPILEGDEVSGSSAPANSIAGLTFTGAYNFLGLPAITIPVGYLTSEDTNDPTEVGMPVGLQLVARWWSEDVLIGVAKQMEEILGDLKKPAVHYDVLLG